MPHPARQVFFDPIPNTSPRPCVLLNVGVISPRKRQLELLDVAETLLTRQTNELDRLLTHVEIAARRRLSGELDRLTQMSCAIDAIGIDGTLARGFTLPLDKDRRIIRTANALQSLASFELLFRDGSVACRPAEIN